MNRSLAPIDFRFDKSLSLCGVRHWIWARIAKWLWWMLYLNVINIQFQPDFALHCGRNAMSILDIDRFGSALKCTAEKIRCESDLCVISFFFIKIIIINGCDVSCARFHFIIEKVWLHSNCYLTYNCKVSKYCEFLDCEFHYFPIQ